MGGQTNAKIEEALHSSSKGDPIDGRPLTPEPDITVTTGSNLVNLGSPVIGPILPFASSPPFSPSSSSAELPSFEESAEHRVVDISEFKPIRLSDSSDSYDDDDVVDIRVDSSFNSGTPLSLDALKQLNKQQRIPRRQRAPSPSSSRGGASVASSLRAVDSDEDVPNGLEFARQVNLDGFTSASTQGWDSANRSDIEDPQMDDYGVDEA